MCKGPAESRGEAHKDLQGRRIGAPVWVTLDSTDPVPCLQWKAQHPAAALVALTRDLLLVAVAAVYSFYAFNLGTGALPPQLQRYVWALRDYQQQHQAAAALLLLYALFVAILSKR